VTSLRQLRRAAQALPALQSFTQRHRPRVAMKIPGVAGESPGQRRPRQTQCEDDQRSE